MPRLYAEMDAAGETAARTSTPDLLATSIRRLQRHLRSVQVNDFPPCSSTTKDKGPPVEKSRPITEMERSNREVAEHLDLQIFRPQIHERRLCLSVANLRKDDLECFLILRTSVRTLREGARIEDRRVVIERETECIPVEIVESADELRKRLPHVSIGRCSCRLCDYRHTHHHQDQQ
jgi:hypothetical protein